MVVLGSPEYLGTLAQNMLFLPPSYTPKKDI